jgi:sugar phosphate isomerase/epimerase
MKISASYWIFEGGLEGTLPISEAMEQASQLGFDAIELGTVILWCILSRLSAVVPMTFALHF